VHFKTCFWTIISEKCPFGFSFLPGAGGCYKLLQEDLTWGNASLQCQSSFPNSRLAVIQNQAQNNAIVSYLKTFDANRMFFVLYFLNISSIIFFNISSFVCLTVEYLKKCMFMNHCR